MFAGVIEGAMSKNQLGLCPACAGFTEGQVQGQDFIKGRLEHGLQHQAEQMLCPTPARSEQAFVLGKASCLCAISQYAVYLPVQLFSIKWFGNIRDFCPGNKLLCICSHNIAGDKDYPPG